MTDHPFGVPRGTIEEPAFDILRGAQSQSTGFDIPSDRQITQIAMLHSIATSLLRIADHFSNIERNLE